MAVVFSRLTIVQDTIRIKKLKISTLIGVPDEERAQPQELCVSVEMTPEVAFDQLNDEIEGGVDYYQVSLEIQKVASAHPRKLIETLAEDLASHILQNFKVLRVDIEVEKYILKNTDHVGVKISRPRA